jgi:hypothetical protein
MFPLPEENLQRKLISFKTCFQNVIKTLVYFSADVVRKKKSQVWWFMPVIPVLGRLIRKIPSLRPSWLCSETLTQQKKATSVCLIFCHSKQSSKSFLILKKKKKSKLSLFVSWLLWSKHFAPCHGVPSYYKPKSNRVNWL